VTRSADDSHPESLDREALTEYQLRRLRRMLGAVLPTNAFYRQKLSAAGIGDGTAIRGLADYRALPFTTREELSADRDANPPYGTNLTFPVERYVRLHQTSGTRGLPLRWLDTSESWQWLVGSWVHALEAAGVTAADRVFVAFSFGPFIGFWCAFEAAQRLGALVIPGGAMTSEQRARAIVENGVTVLASTPTYALRLAEAGTGIGLDAASTSVRITVNGGEPGASIPATKRRIEEAWAARCFDHAGATEVGSWGFECREGRAFHLQESEFIGEVVDPVTLASASEGELVLTGLGRPGMPVVRYRTGDRVRLSAEPCPCGRAWLRLDGGVIGRVDDALLIRGVTVFPSAFEEAIRRCAPVTEFSVEVTRPHDLDELIVRVETPLDCGDVTAQVASSIRDVAGLTARIVRVAAGTLPRFESKAQRVIDRRAESPSRT
jgi:phenylacetate-CoA ligase